MNTQTEQVLYFSLPEHPCDNLLPVWGQTAVWIAFPWLCMRLFNHYLALLLCKLVSIFSTCNQQVNHHCRHIYLGYVQLKCNRTRIYFCSPLCLCVVECGRLGLWRHKYLNYITVVFVIYNVFFSVCVEQWVWILCCPWEQDAWCLACAWNLLVCVYFFNFYITIWTFID